MFTCPPEIEKEIRRICAGGVRGYWVDLKRAAELNDKYPQEYARISREEKDKAVAELNPLFRSR